MSCDFIALATPGVQKLKPYQPGKPVEELERELGIANITKLASNENPLPLPDSVRRTLESQLASVARYPDGSGFRLKQALADFHGIEANRITLGNGSNDVLELLARAYLKPGDEVIFSEHAFAVYPLVTLACSAVPVMTPAVNYGHDLAAMKEAVTDKTRIIFLANPNNPTGTWFDKEALRVLLSGVPEQVLVVLDEAYAEYVNEPGYPNGLALLHEYPNLVVTRTFSKAYGLAGLRAGYSVSHPDVADVLNRVRQPFNMNSLAMEAAVAVLNDKAFLQASLSLNQSGLRQLEKGFGELGIRYIPSIGNFISFDCNGDAAVVYDKLLRAGVIVRPIAAYGLPDFLRVSVGLPEENQRFLASLQQVMLDLGRL